MTVTRKENAALMHRYVIAWMLLFGAIAVTFPIAIWRVSQNPRYIGQAVRSENCESQSTSSPVSWWQNCRNLSVRP
jgi:hypothetical protein